MARRSERRALWGIAPGSLRAALDEQQREARRRIRELQSELDAERAEQESLERDLQAGRERLNTLLRESEQAAQGLEQVQATLALAAGRLEEDRSRAEADATQRLQRLRLEEVRLRADLAEARRALRATIDGLRSALNPGNSEGLGR